MYPDPLDMRALLGVLLVFSVSGDDTINGTLGDSVVLPCNCSESNLAQGVKWQMGKPNPTKLVLKFDGTTSKAGPAFVDRARILLSGNSSSNCSVLLSNITAEDQGPYTCIFEHNDNTYQQVDVNLSVSANYTVCLNESDLDGGVKVFHCVVSGRYRDTTIRWTMDGQPVRSTTTTSISNTTRTETSNGQYHFNSALRITTNVNPAVKCDIHIDDTISAIITDNCENGLSKIQSPTMRSPRTHTARYHHFVTIPFLALGLIFLFWCLTKVLS